MKKKCLICVLLGFILSVPKMTCAQFLAPGLEITKLTSDSDLIVVVRLTGFVANDQHHSDSNITSQQHGSDSSGTLDLDQLNPPGIYSFRVLQVIKGNCGSILTVNMPAVNNLNYNYFQSQFKVSDSILLFLKQNAAQDLVPTDENVPMTPVVFPEPKYNLPAPTLDMPTLELRILKLLLSSLVDPNRRRVLTFLLHNVNDSMSLGIFKRYMDDPDVYVQGNVLLCLAEKSQVEVIPKIADLQLRLALQGTGTFAVLALRGFQVRAAVPFLNPLMFSPNEYTRVNAMGSLQRIADPSSVPYLILALRDPDPQGAVPYQAYHALHDITKQWGGLKNPEEVKKQQGQIITFYSTWWANELEGKHAKQTSKLDTTPIQIHPQKSPSGLLWLNLQLIAASATAREGAVTKLSQIPDRASIPYLVVALQDPDEKVAYGSYRLLHQLISGLEQSKTASDFHISGISADSSIYSWWRDELLGKHVHHVLQDQ